MAELVSNGDTLILVYDKADFTEIIRQLRKKFGLRELARLLGLPHTTVHAYQISPRWEDRYPSRSTKVLLK